jgi:hypothetical protein
VGRRWRAWTGGGSSLRHTQAQAQCRPRRVGVGGGMCSSGNMRRHGTGFSQLPVRAVDGCRRAGGWMVSVMGIRRAAAGGG